MNSLLTTLNLVAAWVIAIAGVLAVATLLIIWAWWLFNFYVKFTPDFYPVPCVRARNEAKNDRVLILTAKYYPFKRLVLG